MVGIETVGESLGHVGLLGSEGEQVLAFSNLELGHSLVLLDEDGCISLSSTFLRL